MTPEYEYLDIDPSNPPEMPLQNTYHCDGKENPQAEFYTETLIAIVSHDGEYRFVDNDFQTWKFCKLRKEKPIDFRNRWVKIKTWAEQESKYGLDEHGFISISLFSKLMELGLPANRIVFINSCGVYTDIKARMWNANREMISEILPLDYQPERELDDTVKRQWFYSNASGEKYINQWFVTEKHFVQNFCTANGVVSYAPGLICPEEKDWRKV